MAVVYAVMLDYGFNKTSFGRSILGECFVNDLAPVIDLGLIFAPFTYKTLIFIAVTILLIFILPSALRFDCKPEEEVWVEDGIAVVASSS